MSVSIGRAALNDLYGLSVRGDRVSFRTEIDFGSVDRMKAVRQQLAGLVANRDEEVVPFAWSEDSSLDGFYRVIGVDVPSSDMALSTGWISDVQIELERIPGFGNPTFEVTAQSVVRTNGHGVTAPSGIIASALVNSGNYYDLRPSLLSATQSSQKVDDGGSGGTLYTWKATAPVALTAYRYSTPPSEYYDGTCMVEAKFGSSWYPITGRQFPRGRQWRISNGFVRLVSSEGAAGELYGKFEVFDQYSLAWESQLVAHAASSGTSGQYIGAPGGTAVIATPTILRNSPEQVAVKVTDFYNGEWTYSLQRGAWVVVTSWTLGTAAKWGTGFAPSAYAASTSFTGGVARTSNDANGNRMVFGVAEAMTADTTNGYCYQSSFATSGTAWWGIDYGGGGRTTVLRDEFLAAASVRQRVVIR